MERGIHLGADERAAADRLVVLVLEMRRNGRSGEREGTLAAADGGVAVDEAAGVPPEVAAVGVLCGAGRRSEGERAGVRSPS